MDNYLNLELIDTVKSIVDNYGTEVLSEPKFWNLLTDLYSFKSDYSLKNVFRHCIASGYVNEIIDLLNDRSATKTAISRISTSEGYTDPDQKAELYATLFSIAVGIGTLNKQDYVSYIQRTFSSPASSSDMSAEKKSESTPPQPVKNYKPGNFYVSVISGIGFLLLGTLSYYGFLYHGWRMFVIILITGILQILYSSILFNNCSNANTKWNNQLKCKAASCYIVIIIGYIINAFVPILLCYKNIRLAAYIYFKPLVHTQYTQQDIDSPGIFSILLSFAVIGLLISFKSLIYNNIKKIVPYWNPLNWGAIAVVSLIILFIYSILFLLPKII